MPDQPDFKMFTDWANETFDHLKELFKHEVARHVTTRMLTLGSVILTVLGVFSFFGVQKGIELVVDEIREDAKKEITEQIRLELEREMQKMRDIATEGRITVGVTRELLDFSKAQLSSMSRQVDEQISELEDSLERTDDLALELRDFEDDFAAYRNEVEAGRSDIDELLAETKRLVDLNQIGLLAPPELLARLEMVSHDLSQSVEPASEEHQITLAQRTLDALAAKEFKSHEEALVDRVVEGIVRVFERHPAEGSMNFSGEAFRTVRVRGIMALREFARRPTTRHPAIGALTRMLVAEETYHERDGAAWALRSLAEDDLPADVDPDLARRALQALVFSLTNPLEDSEVRRHASGSLRRISKASALDRALLTPDIRRRASDALSSDDDRTRAYALEFVELFYKHGAWGDELEARLTREPDERLRLRAATILGEHQPAVLLRTVAQHPDLGRELEGVVESARESKADELKTRARKRLRESRFGEAMAAYRSYLELKPEDITARRVLAELYLISGRHGDSEAMARLTLEQAGKQRSLDQLHLVLAMALAGRPWESELATLERLVEESPVERRYWEFLTLSRHIKTQMHLDEALRAELVGLIEKVDPAMPHAS